MTVLFWVLLASALAAIGFTALELTVPGRRSKALKWMIGSAAVAIAASIGLSVQMASLQSEDAESRRLGFASWDDRRLAEESGITDAERWTAHLADVREKEAREGAAFAAEAERQAATRREEDAKQAAIRKIEEEEKAKIRAAHEAAMAVERAANDAYNRAAVAEYNAYAAKRDREGKADIAARSRRGPSGYPLVKMKMDALVCVSSDRLLSATDAISRKSQIWRIQFPDCAILRSGQEVEYLSADGFSAGIHGYRKIRVTTPDRSASTEAYTFVKMLDREPSASELRGR